MKVLLCFFLDLALIPDSYLKVNSNSYYLDENL